MSAAVATAPSVLPSTSRSRSRPPRGAVGLGPLPADLVASAALESTPSNRTLIETLARSLSRPRQSSTSRAASPTVGHATLTREEWLASNGGQPRGALGMGARSPSPPSSTSGEQSPRGRTSQEAGRPEPRRREWSVTRREWVEAGSSSAASAVEVLLGSSTGEKSASSSRSASPDRGRRAAIVREEASGASSSQSRSRSRAGAVLDKVRRGLLSPRSSHATLHDEEQEPIVPNAAV